MLMKLSSTFMTPNNKIVNNAIAAIAKYVYIGNESAYKGLIKFYLGLGPAESLEDVYIQNENCRYTFCKGIRKGYDRRICK